MSSEKSQSSSVSMFVEDSRNTNSMTPTPTNETDPRENMSRFESHQNPTRFYRITSFVHPIVTTQVRSETAAATSTPAHRSSHFYDSCDDCINNSHGHGRVRKPREIIHKIRREESFEEEKENDFLAASSQPPIFYSNPISTDSVRQPMPYNRRCASATLSLHHQPSISLKSKRHSIHVSNNCYDNRKVTSVNVTLHSPSRCRSPSLSPPDGESGCDWRESRSSNSSERFCSGGNRTRFSPMAHTAAKSLVYSTCGNSRDGFRSQLQIQIGPTTGSGSVSASRRRNQNTNTSSASSVQQMSADLIAAQLERKDKLMRALNSERSVMAKLGAEISLLRTKLQPLPNLERLKNENQRLRIECGVMATEVDLYDNGAVPLGWTLEEFYQGINPGQDANALLFSSSGRRPTGTRIGPPPRPPPPRFLSIPPQPAVDSRTGEWYCTMCTFQNHPELSKCEQCDMVRVITPSSPARPR